MNKLLLGAIVFVGCQRDGARDVAETCDQNATSITDSSVGPLYLNEPVGALRTRCAAVADTTITMPRAGWTDTIAAKQLIVAGAPVLATFRGEQILALRVTAPGPRTLDGIEVGTGVGRFRNSPGVRVSMAPQSPAVILQDRAHCGTTFELSGWGGATMPADSSPPLVGPDLASWPDSIRVTAITVATCTDRSTNRSVDSAFNAREDSIAAERAAVELPQPGITPSAPALESPAPVFAPSGVDRNPAPTPGLRGRLIVPVQGVAVSALRDTYAEARGTRSHEALDIAAPRGTPVLSAMDGKLTRLFDSKTGGLMVYAADPDDEYILLYGHLDRYADGLRNGMALKQGQVIGYVGTTGNAPPETPHLHFGILRGKPSVSWSRGIAVNPFELLTRR
ncbi:MAG TPA: M23 family metallopeptidase [Gemmatimonadaceae bacterium]|nr:M23 family metallopeptidase [Gemmatimonadaceae bacterium]